MEKIFGEMEASDLWAQGELWLAGGLGEDASDDLGVFPTGLAQLSQAVVGVVVGDGEEESAGGLGVKEEMVARMGKEAGVVDD